MSEPSAESTSSNVLWDVVRYMIVAAAAGWLIWYYFFNTPVVYVSRECTGKTLGTDYIVKVARFPEHADWNQMADAIQERLDKLEPPARHKAVPELALYLSDTDILRGFAVDGVAELLDEHNIADYLVEIGSAVRCKGKKTPEKDWIVGIEKPAIELSGEFPGLQQVLPLLGRSLAVCQAKQPGEYFSVAVIALTCTHADAWAAALLTLGEQKGIELADQHGIAALFLRQSGSDVVEVSSKHWPRSE